MSRPTSSSYVALISMSVGSGLFFRRSSRRISGMCSVPKSIGLTGAVSGRKASSPFAGMAETIGCLSCRSRKPAYRRGFHGRRNR